MERKSLRWPWITAVVVCIIISVFCVVFTIIRIQDSIVPPEPDYVRQQFAKLFADPDWESLYAMSTNEHSAFENGSVVKAYMNHKIGDKELQLFESPKTNDPTRLFYVLCDDTLVATFSLLKSDMSINHVYLYLEGNESAWIYVPLDFTVSVNGIALDDSFLVYTMHTKAESYLPEGVHGTQMKGYFVGDLLMSPTVTAVDQNGEMVTLLYDEVTNVYYTEIDPPAQITDQQRQFVAGAATADAMYALAGISNKELAEFFDSKTDLYKMLTENPRNYQKLQSISVEDVEVGEFCQYSDTLFSANVKLTQKIIRTNGTLKTYHADKTYIFELRENGEYRVIAYTNEHLTEKVEQVKLIFVMADEELMTQMVDKNATSVTGPDMSKYRGFRGWAVETRCEDDSIQATIRILPDGTVLGGLDPMVLKPVFPRV